MVNWRGLWINIEGIDCTGKGEQTIRLHKYLAGRSEDNTILTTHEPTSKAREIKRELTSSGDPTTNNRLMLDLYVRDRIEHEREVILPILNSGGIVITNRHKFSTDAYQSAQGSLSLDYTMRKQKFWGVNTPDLTLILDIEIDTLRERMERARKERPGSYSDKFEADIHFQERVRDEYREICFRQGDSPAYFGRIELIDGNRPIEEVAESIKITVEPVYKGWEMDRIMSA